MTCNDRTAAGMCGLVTTMDLKCRDPSDPSKCVIKTIEQPTARVTLGFCAWCGSEVDQTELVTAFEKRDGVSLELDNKPFPGSHRIKLCKGCAE